MRVFWNFFRTRVRSDFKMKCEGSDGYYKAIKSELAREYKNLRILDEIEIL